MKLTGLGLGVVSDETILNSGATVSFTVIEKDTGQLGCSGIFEEDIVDGLNNWASEMMTITGVETMASGYIPTNVRVEVTAVVVKPVAAGVLRGQITRALAAMGGPALCPLGLVIENGVMNVTGGGGGTGGTQGPPAPKPTPDLDWSTTVAVVAVAAVVGLVIWKS